MRPHSGDMRVTFPRLPDHQRAYALVERDDTGSSTGCTEGWPDRGLPHDIMHLVAEHELRIRDGIWAGIAAGVVFESMCHVSGRRPPHAAERSATCCTASFQQGLRADSSPTWCPASRPWTPVPGQDQAADPGKTSVLPDTGTGPGRDRRRRAGSAGGAARWARLRVGEELSYEWPGK